MIGTSAMIGSGALVISKQGVALKGIGDIINIILVVMIACLLF